MKKILVIGLGGTIGSVRNEHIALDSNNLKILDYVDCDACFDTASPFSVLSENMSIELWKKLLEYIGSIDFNKYDGVIILHGSDTLAFTSGIIANAYPDKKIILVASDKPIEDKTSNGIANFKNAVSAIEKGIDFPMVSYNGLHRADCITSANERDEFVTIESTYQSVGSNIIYDKNILIINSYVGVDIGNYNFDNIDVVLVGMYHSATVPEEFSSALEATGKTVYYVTHKSSADYETARGLGNIIFNSTIENAYARILLTNGNLVL